MAGLTTTRDIVAKLWNLCHILRDDGVTYNEYVTELTFLLFLKMMAETGREDALPNGYRWSQLTKRNGLEQLDYYKRLLLELGTKGKARVAAIFVDARTMLRKPTNLKALTDAIDELDWFSAREEGLGNLYEGLLEKNAAAQANILRPVRSSIPLYALWSRDLANLSRTPPPAPADFLSLSIITSRNGPTTSSSSPRSKSIFRSTMLLSALSWCRTRIACA
jgi:hypothetical protein